MQQSSTFNRSGARILGFPLEGFSLFQSLLLAFAAAFFTFFATTCIAIFALLIWNAFAAHKFNFADTYLYVGAPAGLLVLLLALPYFATLWFRAKMRG
jgi:CDP-diglyceride synthetase